MNFNYPLSQPFTVYAAADIGGDKINLQLSFPGRPTMIDLYREIESAFSDEMQAVQNQPYQMSSYRKSMFRIDRLQAFEPRAMQWMDLTISGQLTDNMQLYIFQRGVQVVEHQKPIPPPRPPRSSRQTSTVNHNHMMAHQEPTSAIHPAPSFFNQTGVSSLTNTTESAAGYNGYGMLSGYQHASNHHHNDTTVSFTSEAQHYLPTSGAATPHFSTGNRAGAVPETLPAGSATQRSSPVNTRSNLVDQVKIRNVFEYFAGGDGRSSMNKDTHFIDLEGWLRGYKVLRMPLSPATVKDIFARADADADQYINTSDFDNFAANYPVLVDSLYVRIQSAQEETRRRGIVAQHHQLIDELQRRERSATSHHKVALDELRTAENRVKNLDTDVRIKAEEVEQKQADLLQIGDAIEDAMRETTRRERHLAGGRERERQANIAVEAACAAVVEVKTVIDVKENEIILEQEKIRELEAQIAEAKRRIDRRMDEVSQLNLVLTETQEKEKTANHHLTETQTALEPLRNLVREAEAEVERLRENEKSVEESISTIEKDAIRVQSLLQAAEAELHPLRDRESFTKQSHHQAAEELDESKLGLRQLEQDVEDFREHRRQVEEKEAVLVEEEVRLREQRYNLEEREATHYHEKYRHFQETNRLS